VEGCPQPRLLGSDKPCCCRAASVSRKLMPSLPQRLAGEALSHVQGESPKGSAAVSARSYHSPVTKHRWALPVRQDGGQSSSRQPFLLHTRKRVAQRSELLRGRSNDVHSPCGEGGLQRGEGRWGILRRHPTPSPSPQGGGEQRTFSPLPRESGEMHFLSGGITHDRDSATRAAMLIMPIRFPKTGVLHGAA
jgi:hypothetical protein